MQFLDSLRERILKFEQKEFYTHAGAFFGVVFFFIFGILYYYYTSISSLKQSLKKINSKREQAHQILKKLEQVKKQKAEVDTMLSEDKAFKPKGFFDETVQRLHLASKQRREADVTEETIKKQYQEIKISAQFRGITTEQLCKLLEALEQKKRIYMKDLSITKTKGAALDVSLTVATLKHLAGSEQRG